MKWYRKAAEQGDTEAQVSLGIMYVYGQGVIQDYVEAVRWFGKAADLGYPWAQSNLAFMYSKGHGVPQDPVQAHKWYNLAASRFSPGKDRDKAGWSRGQAPHCRVPHIRATGPRNRT